MKIFGENEIEERYTGMQTKDYTGHYICDGNSCNCTWYKTHFFCRHMIFTRKNKGLPLYENKIFPGFPFIHNCTKVMKSMTRTMELN